MKLLADNCVTITFDTEARKAGHDCTRITPDPGDRTLLKTAWQESRTIVTIDKDFGELAIVQQLPHHGIVRLVQLRVRDQAAIGLAALQRYGSELENGAIVTAYYDRVRVRDGGNR